MSLRVVVRGHALVRSRPNLGLRFSTAPFGISSGAVAEAQHGRRVRRVRTKGRAEVQAEQLDSAAETRGRVRSSGKVKAKQGA